MTNEGQKNKYNVSILCLNEPETSVDCLLVLMKTSSTVLDDVEWNLTVQSRKNYPKYRLILRSLDLNLIVVLNTIRDDFLQFLELSLNAKESRWHIVRKDLFQIQQSRKNVLQDFYSINFEQ